MTPEQFALWLQGFVEIRGSVPSEGEWDIIKTHLAYIVFNKVTPNRQVYPLSPGGLPPGPGMGEPYRGNPVNPMINGPYASPAGPWTIPGIPIGPKVSQPWTPATDLPGPSVTCSVSSVTGNDWLSKKDSQGETV